MKPCNVLVVDDDLATLDLICSVLSANGASCLRAQSGTQAMQLATNHALQLVITDINMPELDGLSFVKCISEMLGRSRPPVVILTAYPSLDFTISALRLGATDFLIKPVRPTQLLDVVKRVIGEQAPQRAQESSEGRQAARSRSKSAKPKDASGRALLGIDELRNLRRTHPLLNRLDDTESDLLLELLRSERAGRRLSVSALSISVDNERVSSATALRRIQSLVQAGLIVRIPDPQDARRDFVALTPQTREALELYLAQVAEAFKVMAEVA